MEQTKEETTDREKKEQITTDNQPLTTETKNDNNQSQNSPRQKVSKTKKIVYLNQKVYFPVSIPDKIDFIYNLFYNEELGYIINNAPLFKSSTVYDIGKYFKIKLKYILEIASGILYYIYKNFKIKEKNEEKNEQKRTTEETLNSGEIYSFTEMCELYQDLCNYSGVKILIVTGYIKEKGYKVGDSIHKYKWCLLDCGQNKKFLIDPYLSMGEEKDEIGLSCDFKPFYFCTEPELFIENHIPDEEKNQLLIKTMRVKEFTKKVYTTTEEFYSNVYRYNFKLQNYYKPEFNCKDSEINIKLIIDGMELGIECFVNGRKMPKDKVSISNNNFRNNYEIKIIFTSNGEYKLNIFGKKINTVSEPTILLTYKINVKITNIIKHEEVKKKEIKKKPITHLRMGSPQYQKKKIETSLERQLTKCSSDFDEKIKNKCFDNDSAYLYEPRNKILRIGQDTRFKVRVKGAKNVAVLDGRKWVYLRRKEEELFEGNVVIENENIVLCAMRNKNIFTEVFEFMAIKR